MTTVYDVPPKELIDSVTEKLKENDKITPPEWANYVKTGPHKQRPPAQPDWWYYRAASILYQLYRHGVIGVKKLRNHYGGRRDRGHMPEHKVMAGAKIIRTIIQQLEKAGLVEKNCTPHPKLQTLCAGRRLTKAGRSLLDRLATKIASELGLLH